MKLGFKPQKPPKEYKPKRGRREVRKAFVTQGNLGSSQKASKKIRFLRKLNYSLEVAYLAIKVCSGKNRAKKRGDAFRVEKWKKKKEGAYCLAEKGAEAPKFEKMFLQTGRGRKDEIN